MKILVNTRSLLATLDQEVDGMAFDASDKNRISAALFDVALDHAEGIVLLLENKIYASAYSLSRSLFETFVRATWIQHCATDSEVNRVIKKDEFKLTFGEMLDAVEKKAGVGENAYDNEATGMEIDEQLYARRVANCIQKIQRRLY